MRLSLSFRGYLVLRVQSLFGSFFLAWRGKDIQLTWRNETFGYYYMSMHVLSCLKKIVTNITFDYVRRSDLWTLILCNSVLQTFFSPSVEVIKGALTWRLWRLVILPQDLNLYQLMKWGNICTIKSGATTNWTLPVFSISCEMEPQQELSYQDYFL